MRLNTSLLAAIASLGLATAASAAPVTGQISIGGYAQSANSVGMGTATGLSFASGSSSSPTIRAAPAACCTRSAAAPARSPA